MAYSRVTSPGAVASESLTRDMAGIGMNLGGRANHEANIEDTLFRASREGMDRGDIRVLAVLTTWLSVHGARVNVDRIPQARRGKRLAKDEGLLGCRWAVARKGTPIRATREAIPRRPDRPSRVRNELSTPPPRRGRSTSGRPAARACECPQGQTSRRPHLGATRTQSSAPTRGELSLARPIGPTCGRCWRPNPIRGRPSLRAGRTGRSRPRGRRGSTTKFSGRPSRIGGPHAC